MRPARPCMISDPAVAMPTPPAPTIPTRSPGIRAGAYVHCPRAARIGGDAMRVMLTGATGFIGGHVTRALLEAGHEPVLLVRDLAKLQRQCALHDLDPTRLDVAVGDILDRDAVV